MNIIKDIESLVNKPVDPCLFPVKKGNRIFVGNYVIKIHADYYKVYDQKNNLQGTTQTRLGAVALAKNLNRTYNSSLEIQRLDKLISKNLQDCVFYKNVYNSTKDSERKLNTDMKLCNARSRVMDAEEKLASFIFPKR